MKNKTRGLKFWEYFTYRVKIEEFYPETGLKKTSFVTKVDFSSKTFEFKDSNEIEKDAILKFKLYDAVELMNCMYLNGFYVSIEPWF